MHSGYFWHNVEAAGSAGRGRRLPNQDSIELRVVVKHTAGWQFGVLAYCAMSSIIGDPMRFQGNQATPRPNQYLLNETPLTLSYNQPLQSSAPGQACHF